MTLSFLDFLTVVNATFLFSEKIKKGIDCMIISTC